MNRISREVFDILPLEYKKTFIIGKKWGLLEKVTFICTDISVSEYFRFQSLSEAERSVFMYGMLEKWYVKKCFGRKFASLFLDETIREKIITMFFDVFPKSDPSLKVLEKETNDVASLSRSFTAFCEKFAYTSDYVLSMPARTYLRMVSDSAYISRESYEEGKKENKMVDRFDKKPHGEVINILQDMKYE